MERPGQTAPTAGTKNRTTAKVSTSLVLGSGGARGLTHIGAIRCLEDRGFAVRNTAGASIGALVGGIHAAGKLDVYADWVSALQKRDIVRLLDWSLSGDALFKGEKIIQVLKQLIGDWNIEDLPIGFTAVATELNRGREVWLNRGPLFEAIRASIAVPTIFAPVKRGNLVLVDGGIVNPLPIAPTFNDQTDVTIAVDLNGYLEGPRLEKAPPDEQSNQPARRYRAGIARFIDSVWKHSSERSSPSFGFSELVTRSMETMQQTITKLKLAAYSPTVVITIPRDLCGFFDFYRARELIAYGYRRAAETLQREGLPR